MRKIFQQVVTQIARPSASAISKRLFLAPKSQKRMMMSSSLVLIGQFAFTTASLNDFYEVEVKADLNDGESKEIQVGPKQDDCVLLCKVNGEYYCVSNKCSHYGAPLSQGLLIGDKVKCPWHNASFSVKDGSMEEGPMMNGIQTFPVQVSGEKVTIKIKKDLLNQSRQLNMVTKGTDPSHYVIVGGGPAGQSAAESLRQGGFQGEITIVTAEQFLPYDRTGMSKAIFQVGPQGSAFRNQEFFDKYGINVKTGSTVEGVSYANQELQLKGGSTLKYDKLLIATGGTPVRPRFNGSDLKNVFTFRTVADVHQIKEAATKAKNIVIVGSSFIGLETAASLKGELKDAVNVTVVGMTQVAFEDQLGTQVGKALQDFHASKGVNFKLGQTVKGLKGEGQVSHVELLDGSTIDADLVIFGVGVRPSVSFLGDLTLSKTNGGVETDAFLRTSQKNVFAAGDIASYPYYVSGEQVRVEHHNEAIYQGFVAAMNMIGNPTPVSQVPFFWTRHYDKTLQYSGIGYKFDDVIIDGDLEQLKFVAYYTRNGRVIASASMQVPQAQQIISEAIRLNIMPSAEQLRSKMVTLEQIKQSLSTKAGNCHCRRAELSKNKL